MLRRSHKKSRKGAKCDECRRRHIRCDQQRPICINCSQADRTCSYRDQGAHTNQNQATLIPHEDDTASRASSFGPPHSIDTHEGVLADHSDGNDTSSLVNLTHLELFNHFNGIVNPLFVGPDPDLGREYLRNYHEAAFAEAYLMHEILAFAAKHLSLTDLSPKSQFYAEQATVLQTRALSLFNASLQKPEPTNISATFLISSLLGTHLLSDTNASRHADLQSFLTAFDGYLKVHRGVRPIFDEYKQHLLETPLRPFLVWGYNLSMSKGTGPECQPIREMLACRNLEIHTIEAYSEAINLLQALIDGYKNQPSFPGPVPQVTIWLSMVKPDYTELLIAREPEALVIFAYYGAMTHCYHRNLWLVGDSGRHIVELVTKSLGDVWSTWLKWPREVLEPLDGAI